MAEEVGVIQVVEFMCSAIGKGQAIANFFQSGQPTATDIAAAVAAEVQQIFQTQLHQAEIDKATAAFTTAQQFFLGPRSTYQNAIRNGKTNDELADLITGKSGNDDGLGMRDLRTYANEMAKWVKNPAQNGVDQATVNQMATLYLAIQTFICAVESELARLSMGTSNQSFYEDNARSAAQNAVDTMKTVLINIVIARTQSLTIGQWGRHIQSFDPYDAWRYGASMHDSWPHGNDGDTIRTRADARGGASDDDKGVINRLMGPYMNLAWYGGDKAQGALNAALNGASDMDDGSADTFRRVDLPSVREFGDWAVSVRSSLLALDNIARGGTVPRQDGWRWCNGCGTLFFPPEAGQTQCPHYGAFHHTGGGASSSNYVVTIQAGGAWRWCKRCGALHHAGGSDRCPANPSTAHSVDGSASYTVETGGDDTEIQSGWRWCNRCGVLHYPGGPNQCIAGGAHASGTDVFRLERFGHWSPPISGPPPF